MCAQRDGRVLGPWAWLLILLLPPVIIAQTLSYRDAVLQAVDDFNQRSLDTNLYRLLALESQPQGEENPESPKPVRFTMKETVCSKASQHSLEQCDFKQNGLVMQCVGTVTLDQDSDLNIDCNLLPQHSHKIASLDEFLKKGEKKIGEKLENLGQKIKNLFEKFVSKTDLRGSTQPCFWDSEK